MATWREPTVRKLDAEAVPWTSNLVRGEVVPMPIRLFPLSIYKVPVSKLRLFGTETVLPLMVSVSADELAKIIFPHASNEKLAILTG